MKFMRRVNYNILTKWLGELWITPDLWQGSISPYAGLFNLASGDGTLNDLGGN